MLVLFIFQGVLGGSADVVVVSLAFTIPYGPVNLDLIRKRLSHPIHCTGLIILRNISFTLGVQLRVKAHSGTQRIVV